MNARTGAATLLHPQSVRDALQHACRAELAAMKPGNVSVYADGHGMTVEDFRRSADAAAPVLARPGLRVGQRIAGAIDATRRVVGCNTNLGIVLLCAPLAHTALRLRGGQSLRAALGETLQALDEEDARLAYAAIRQARPGGMGEVHEHDIRSAAPRVTLLEAMAAAADRDRIACQYAHGYRDLFDFAEPHLRAALDRWHSEEWAVVSLYLALLAAFGDSLVARKHGAGTAAHLRADAARVAARLEACSDPAAMQARLIQFDRRLKARRINPGTTADLVVATLLVRQLHDDMQATGHAPVPGREVGSGCRPPPVLLLAT